VDAMRDRAHENLIELLQRFMDEPAAQTAHEDIQAGERWLDDAPPTPAPNARLLATIKTQMAVSALRRHRMRRLFHASLAAAAAVVVLSDRTARPRIGEPAPHILRRHSSGGHLGERRYHGRRPRLGVLLLGNPADRSPDALAGRRGERHRRWRRPGRARNGAAGDSD